MNFDLDYFLNFVFNPSPAMWNGIFLTIVIALLAQTFGSLFGALFAIIGMSKFAVLRWFVQIYVGFWRGTPVLVQLVLVYFGLPYIVGWDMFPPAIDLGLFLLPGAVLAGLLTFIAHETALMSEIVRSGILSVDPGQKEAAQSMGMTPAQAMARIIMPQAVRIIIPPLGNQLNMMLKTTSLLSVIAVSEMFRISQQMVAATYKSFEVYLGVSIYYLILTFICTVIQRIVEKKIARGFVSTKSAKKIELESISS